MAKRLAERTRYARCWAARTANDLPALLELAADPTLTADEVATIAPSSHDRDAPVELVSAVLDHPPCSPGVAGRFAGHHNTAIRFRVAQRPDTISSTLEILAIDTDEEVRAAAAGPLTVRRSGHGGPTR